LSGHALAGKPALALHSAGLSAGLHAARLETACLEAAGLSAGLLEALLLLLEKEVLLAEPLLACLRGDVRGLPLLLETLLAQALLAQTLLPRELALLTLLEALLAQALLAQTLLSRELALLALLGELAL